MTITSEENNKSRYKWYVLGLVAVTSYFTNGVRLCLPVLFDEISKDLGLSILQIGMVWGMDPLAGIFVSIFSGLLIDRFGVKRTIVFIVFFIGIFSAVRGLAFNFLSLAAAMFLFGSLVATTPTVLPKAISLWFRGRYLGLANGIYSTTGAFGSMTATMLSATVFSPLFGSWRWVLLFYGIPPIILALLWFLTYNNPSTTNSTGITDESVSIRKSLSHVIHIRNVWAIGIIILGSYGSYAAFLGYLPIYLRGIGWAPSVADSATTLLIMAIAASAIPISTLSNKVESRGRLLIPILVFMTILFCLIPIAEGISLWIFIALIGIMVGGLVPITLSMTMEIKGIDGKYTGTALGITASFSMIGCSIFPPLGNSFASIGPSIPFVVWGLLLGISLVLFFIVKNRRKMY